jgi:hypothetical protein
MLRAIYDGIAEAEVMEVATEAEGRAEALRRITAIARGNLAETLDLGGLRLTALDDD